MSFQVGEKIGFMHEKGSGVIVKFPAPGQVLVRDESGFERTMELNEIIRIYGTEYQLDQYTNGVNEDDTLQSANYMITKEVLTGRRRASEVWEIDLHIEEILESHAGMSNTEILIKQMTEFKSFFKKARARNIPKLVVIHGVGEGVLKNEIRTFLSKKDYVEFYDASYLEYGKGATEIRLFQSH
jgi:DNA-nicking Smr family endonuclease